jgi:NADPH-dependent ferric siderophore reductase
VPDSSFVVAVVSVASVRELSPSFVRIEFAGPDLAEFGTAGPVFDQRIKLIFPAASSTLPDIAGAESWWDAWRALPEHERGAMRTYSVRDLLGEGTDRRLVVDLVLHLVPGATGPASAWATSAAVGDRVIVIGPHRSATDGGGIEFAPGDAERILLAGDETAVPAIARILADLPADACGDVFLEVPHAHDATDLVAPAGVTVRWLPRHGDAVGARLVPRVVEHFGGRALGTRIEPAADDEVWETPTHSSSGEGIAASGGVPGLYAWIAGESGVVTALRRHLVRDLGLDRAQVAFMGYWRLGVAMRA